MIAGNLCRCTGYQNIVDAVLRAAELHRRRRAAAVMVTRYIGAPVRRVEDLRLITGNGRYTDDIGVGTGALEVAFVRSPHAHARIGEIDVTEAWTSTAWWRSTPTRTSRARPPSRCRCSSRTRRCTPAGPATRWPTDVVHHVGEPIVMVVAESRYLAEDAAARIVVEYDVLPAVVGIPAARAAEHAVHEDMPDNVAAHLVQQVGDVDAGMAAAPHRRSTST